MASITGSTSTKLLVLGLGLVLTFFVAFQPHQSGVNENARLSQALNLVAHGDLSSEGFDKCTHDTTIGRDGKTYSNKLPGPSFIAAGILFFWQLSVPLEVSDTSCTTPPFKIVSDEVRLVLIFFINVLPLSISCYLLLNILRQQGVSCQGQVLFGLAFLFGNTAVSTSGLLMGHATAGALFSLVLVYLFRRSFVAAGFWAALMCLFDPAAFFILPVIVVFVTTTFDGKRLGRLSKFFVGASLPMLLLGGYNYKVFGAPWRSILTDNGAAFRDQGLLFGLFSWIPSLEVLGHLIVGPERGILVTNPWLLGVIFLFAPRTLDRIRKRFPDWYSVSLMLICTRRNLI